MTDIPGWSENHMPWGGAQALPLPSQLDIGVRHIPVKRTFDIVFSLLVFAIGFPVFLIIALLVRLSSPGKLFYAQERVGRGGKTFACYKFRSMYPDAEKRLAGLLAADPALQREWEANFKLKNDPRITPIGAFLRKTSLDELPQFWNVLKGDLSVVGPRPVVQAEVSMHFGAKAYKILSIRPGLTGLWQVSGRSDTGYALRISLDEKYIEERTLLLDLKIVLKTIPAMIFTRGAY